MPQTFKLVIGGPSPNFSAEIGKALNAILWATETAYREIAADVVDQATAGLIENQEYVVTVDGKATGKAGIARARLFNPVGVRVTRKADGKAMQAAWNAAWQSLNDERFTRTPMTPARLRQRQQGGTFQNGLVTAIDGKEYLSPTLADFQNATVVEIWSKARHAGPLQKIYANRLFVAAARLTARMPGVTAFVSWGDPTAYRQIKIGTQNPLAVPILTITAAGAAGRAQPGRRRGRRR